MTVAFFFTDGNVRVTECKDVFFTNKYVRFMRTDKQTWVDYEIDELEKVEVYADGSRITIGGNDENSE